MVEVDLFFLYHIIVFGTILYVLQFISWIHVSPFMYSIVSASKVIQETDFRVSCLLVWTEKEKVERD